MIQPVFVQNLSFKGNKQKIVRHGSELLKKYSGFREPVLETKKVYNTTEDLVRMNNMNMKMQKAVDDYKRKSLDSIESSKNLILD